MPEVNAEGGSIDHLLPGWLSDSVLWLGLLWLGFVGVCYSGVDEGSLLPILGAVEGRVWVCAGVLAVLVAGSGYWLGRTVAGPRRRRSGLALVVMLAGIALAPVISAQALHALESTLWQQADGLRASLVVGIAMAGGAGVFLGLGAGVGFGRWWNALTLLPFLVLTGLAGGLLELLGLCWCLLVAATLGQRILGATSRSRGALGCDNLLVSIALGLAVLILSTLGLGRLGLATPLGLVALLVLMTGVGRRHLGSALAAVAQLGVPARGIASLSGAVAHTGLTALFCVYWLAALAPEMGPDALGFRVAGPAIWLREGSIHPLPEMLGSYGYCAGEMLYLLLMPLLGLSVAKLVQFGLLVLVLISIRRDVLEDRSGRGALWVFTFFASSLLWVQIAWGFVDVCQLFFCYATLLALQHWLERGRDRAWLIAAGIAAGVATSIKLNGGMIGVIAGGVVVLSGRRRFGDLLRDTVALASGFLLTLTPWMLHVYLVAGNPAFPFLNGVFPSPLLPTAVPAALFEGASPWQLPWQLFFTRWQFVEIGNYHPALLATLPVGLVGAAWLRGRAMLWGFAAVVSGALWMLTEQNARYSLFAVLFFAITVALGMHALSRAASRVTRAVFSAVLVLACLLGLLAQVCRKTEWMFRGVHGVALPTRVTLGGQDEERYLRIGLPSFGCGQWLNQHVGAAARLWQVPPIRDHLYFDARATSLPHGALAEIEPLGQILYQPELFAAPAQIHQVLVGRGYTHILYQDTVLGLADLPDARRTGVFGPEFTRAYLRLCFADRGYRLYEICSVSAPARILGDNLLADPELASLDEGMPKAWEVQGSVAPEGLGSTALHLSAGARISQLVEVEAGVNYCLRLVLRTPREGESGRAEIHWRGPGGQLRLICHCGFPGKAVDGKFEYLQTAPAGATQAFLVLVGGEVLIESVELRAIK